MKTIKDILYKAGIVELLGNPSDQVTMVTADSRRIEPGCMFVAVKGTQTDGHQFISKAVESGASSIVCEVLPEELHSQINYIRVKDSSFALGHIASNFYDNPSKALTIVGVTGTNGKTTIATLLYNLFTALGYRCGLLSTIKNYIGDREIAASHTTPDALQLNSLLSEMVSQGVTHCFMEVSSHAIVQNRIVGIDFSGGIFTNLSHDHLDYHKSFDEYRDAKKKFFDHLKKDAFALTNADDRNGKIMVQNTSARVHFYGIKNMADFRCRIVENRFDGLELNIDGTETWFKLVGTFNAYNLLAAYATAVLLGLTKENVLLSLSGLDPVEGRFDHFTSDKGITVIVDYAHTPDALGNVLKTIASIRTGNEQVITVVGAGGNRDSAKRPVMARIATELSNRIILTSDNPRFEEPESIIEEMLKGVTADKKSHVLAIVNRKEAIKTACMLATPGDIILVAGKGHEKYQEIKGTRHPFDDKKIVREIMLNENPQGEP